MGLAKHCDVTVYVGTEVRLLSFLTLVLIALRRSALQRNRVIP